MDESGRSYKAKWGTILPVDLVRRLPQVAAMQGLTIAEFTERALRRALDASLLDLFTPPDVTVVVSEHLDASLAREVSALSLLADYWHTDRLRIYPGSARRLAAGNTLGPELYSDLVVVGGPMH